MEDSQSAECEAQSVQPAAEQTVQPAEPDVLEPEASNEGLLSIGTLVWARQKGFPWWPSLVANDPETKTHYRERPLFYHVQFYGKTRFHAWVGSQSVVLWENGLKLIPKKQSQSMAVALEQATAATTMSALQRIVAYTCLDMRIPADLLQSDSEESCDGSDDDTASLSGSESEAEPEIDHKFEAIMATARKRTKAKRSRPVLAMDIYKSLRYKLLQQDNAQKLPHLELLRKVTAEWMALGEDDRAEYEALAAQERARQAQAKQGKLGDDESHAEGMPSCTVSAFDLYLQEVTPAICTENDLHATRSVRLIRKKALSMWRKLTAEQKEPYKAMLLQFQDAIEKRRPKEPRAPEAIFLSTKTRELRRLLPNVTVERIKAELTAMWEKLSVDEQRPYLQAARDDVLRFNEQMALYDSTFVSLSTDDSALEPQRARASVNQLCGVCEKPGTTIPCEGPCFGSFHLACLGLQQAPEDKFTCTPCATNSHPCFCCKKQTDEPTVPCHQAQCGKHYHVRCIKELPRTQTVPGTDSDDVFVCPLHICANCDLVPVTRNAFVRCVKCPVAYHECCVAAAVQRVNKAFVICARHFPRSKECSSNCCLLCGHGGTLLCCDTCPAAFHVDCVAEQRGFTGPKEGERWCCPDCVGGNKPQIKDIVWAKVGSHRWWPAQIVTADNLSDAVLSLPHHDWSFPLQFFGSHDFNWGDQSSVIAWVANDERGSFSKGAKKPSFTRALEEATQAFGLIQTQRVADVAELRARIPERPPDFKRIRINAYKTSRPPKDEVPECECADSPDSRCSSDDCLNRALFVECDSRRCAAGINCNNRRIQKRQSPKFIEFKTESRGWGLKAAVDLLPGDFVIEYVGEVIDVAECERRLKYQEQNGIASFYMLSLTNDSIIDARLEANQARFINHSCNPNSITQVWNVLGEPRVGIFAKQYIPAGTELTFDYQLDCYGGGKMSCHCGASNCSGFIGVKPLESKATPKSKEAKAKKPKAKNPVLASDDDCFACGDGGDLILCDKKGCTKAYHLECLQLAKPPHGTWYCPWHLCDECGKWSSIMCQECPNSYCSVDHMQVQSRPTGVVPPLADPFLCFEHYAKAKSQSSTHTATTTTATTAADTKSPHRTRAKCVVNAMAALPSSSSASSVAQSPEPIKSKQSAARTAPAAPVTPRASSRSRKVSSLLNEFLVDGPLLLTRSPAGHAIEATSDFNTKRKK